MKNIVRNFLIFFAIFLLIALALSSLGGTPTVPTVGIEALISQLNNQQIKSIDVEGSDLKITLKDDKPELVKKEAGQSLSELLSNLGVTNDKLTNVSIQVKDESGTAFWAGVI